MDGGGIVVVRLEATEAEWGDGGGGGLAGSMVGTSISVTVAMVRASGFLECMG